MEDFRIEFSKEAYKSYKKFDSSMKRRIDKVLLMLLEGSKIDLKPIKGAEDIYRIRVGSYRILFKKIKEEKVYLIAKISSRGDIYH